MIGNDLIKFIIILPKCTTDELNAIYEILNICVVKEHIENDYNCFYNYQILINIDNILQFNNNKEQFIQKYKKQISGILKKYYDNIE